MSIALETYLVRLYLDPDVRHAFLADRHAAATAAGLPPEDVAALARIDAIGLDLTARSIAAKRADDARTTARPSLLTRVLAWWRRARRRRWRDG